MEAKRTAGGAARNRSRLRTAGVGRGLHQGNQSPEATASVPSELTERDLMLIRYMQAIPPEISDGDLKLMRFIGEERMMRIDHAARLSGQSLKGVGRTVERLNGLGYVNAALVLAKEGDRPWLWLTKEGLRLIGLGFRYYMAEPSLWRLSHAFSLVELRLHYAAEHPEWRWVSARTLADIQARRSCKKMHLPDGALETDDGLILLEAEVSPRDEPNVRRHMRENDQLARTHYHCPTADRETLEKIKRSEGLTRTHVLDMPGEILWPARRTVTLHRTRGLASKPGRDQQSLLESPQIPGADFTRRANSSSLDEHEVELLWLLAEEKVVRLDHLGRLMGRSTDGVQRDVDRLVELGYVKSELIFAKDAGKPWQWLTQSGQDVLDFKTGYRLTLPSLSEFNVAFSVIETRLFYAVEHPDWPWVCERKLIYSELFSNKKKHAPPGALESDDGLILVEVELGSVEVRHLRTRMRENEERARTHYHCSDAARPGIEKVTQSEGLRRVGIFDLPGEQLWPAR